MGAENECDYVFDTWNGIPTHAKNISAHLDHANISTTMNIYSHYLQEADERAASKLDALFSPVHQEQNKHA